MGGFLFKIIPPHHPLVRDVYYGILDHNNMPQY